MAGNWPNSSCHVWWSRATGGVRRSSPSPREMRRIPQDPRVPANSRLSFWRIRLCRTPLWWIVYPAVSTPVHGARRVSVNVADPMWVGRRECIGFRGRWGRHPHVGHRRLRTMDLLCNRHLEVPVPSITGVPTFLYESRKESPGERAPWTSEGDADRAVWFPCGGSPHGRSKPRKGSAAVRGCFTFCC